MAQRSKGLVKPAKDIAMSRRNQSVCKRMRELRIREAYTQEEMAAVLKSHLSTVKKIELFGQLPTIDQMRLVVAHFAVSYSWLIDGK